MNILVTGAFGGIGTQVLEEGLNRGYSMSVFELKNRKNIKKARGYAGKLNRLIWGDLTKIEEVKSAVEGQDVIIHLGAVIPPLSEKNPDLAYNVNVGGTKNIIQAAGESDRKIKVLYTSSVSIMGPADGRERPLRVTDPVQATSHYTGQKIECEKLLRDSNVTWAVVRLGAVVNAGLDAGGASLSAMMDEVFKMSLDNRIEGVWNVDAAAALINAAALLAESDSIDFRTFFIGGGENGWQLTVKDFYTKLFGAIGFGMLDESCFSKDPYYTDWMDTEESQKYLNYQNHSFDDFLTAMKKKLRPVRPLVRIFSPVIRRQLEKSSNYR